MNLYIIIFFLSIWSEWFDNIQLFDRTLYKKTHYTGNCLNTFQKNIVKMANQYKNSFTVWKLISEFCLYTEGYLKLNEM